ncbi:hypothetical protein PsorP6_012800 [Peronosclerospora sorghi]|uniref:Uncharacterized protein n=1 Tax=Peronosclerospora sorghi TaxID=230839 RepID=A0ACC0WIB7_9STRA|nr:hypothetical protein PsorP6_012800 [Peronosclerospora sorghi]
MLPLRKQLLRRALQTRAIEWAAIAQKLSDPRARAALDSLRDVHGQLSAEARTYVKEPEAIDFDYYRSVIKNKELVDAMEENYKSISFPTITPEDLDAASKSADLADDLRLDEQATMDQLYAQLDEKVADSKARIEELNELIGLMKETRTSLDTTVDEMTAMYPEVGEEIDDEIANLEWDKDLP